MGSNKIRNGGPEQKSEAPETSSLTSLLADCARIYRIFGMDYAQEQMLALFRQSPETLTSPDELVRGILEAARELRNSIVEDNTEKLQISREDTVELAGRLYELAVNQSESPLRDDLIRETAFFYLAAGVADSFLKWSRQLLDLVQDDSEEHRATLFALGLAQIFIDEPAQAELTFRRLLFVFPKSQEGYFGLALAYLKLDNAPQVERMMEALTTGAPELARIVIRLAAMGNFTADDYAAALETLENP